MNSALNGSDLPGQDRAFVTDLVYGALRYEILLDACLRPLLKRPDKLPPEVLDALRLGAYDVLLRGTPRHAGVHEWVEVVKGTHKKLAGLANAVLRRVAFPEGLSEAERLGLPGWLLGEWWELFGEVRAAEIGAALNDPEPLWLLSYHPQASHSLIEEGCEVRLGPVQDTLAVRPAKPLGELEAFKRGWVQPQNPSSTLPVRLLEPEPGERVLDLASGSGVKAAQLAAAGARPLSIELHEEKLARAARNLERLNLTAEGMVHDLTTLPDVPPAPKVLLDAPCTGTGTLRGNPETRTRVSPETVKALAELQRSLLQTAAALTALGGTLVYAVCALTHTEGAGMMRWFLASHPDFEAETLFDRPARGEHARGVLYFAAGWIGRFFYLPAEAYENQWLVMSG